MTSRCINAIMMVRDVRTPDIVSRDKPEDPVLHSTGQDPSFNNNTFNEDLVDLHPKENKIKSDEKTVYVDAQALEQDSDIKNTEDLKGNQIAEITCTHTERYTENYQSEDDDIKIQELHHNFSHLGVKKEGIKFFLSTIKCSCTKRITKFVTVTLWKKNTSGIIWKGVNIWLIFWSLCSDSIMPTTDHALFDRTIERWALESHLDQPQAMRFEVLRLLSFTSWNHASPVHPTHLARAGFFYTGYADEVQCFLCGGRVLQWETGDKPLEEHRRHFPTCRFILGEDDTNQPHEPREGFDPSVLGSQISDGLAALLRSMQELSQQRRSDQPAVAAGGRDLAPQGQDGTLIVSDTSSLSRTQSISGTVTGAAQSVLSCQQFTVASGCGSQDRENISVSSSQGQPQRTDLDSMIQPPTVARDGPVRSEQASAAAPAPSLLTARDFMKSEHNRLATFDKWPKKDKVNPKLMAAAGLYFVGPADKVKCAFCEGAMMNWDAGDVPQDEHFRYFGDRCAYIRGEPAGNIPLPGDQSVNQQDNPRSGRSSNRTEHERTLNQLGIVVDRPRQPALARESDRLATFKSWPQGKSQTPQVLASAGFYFTGIQDQVRCFFCDGGLRNWEPDDDPWREHARWFPKCGFMKQAKGTTFIHEANRSAALVNQQSQASSSTSSKSEESSTSSQGASSSRFDRRMVTAQMATRQVQIALDMGFPRGLVQSVVEMQLRNTGQGFSNAESLVDAVMNAESAQSFPQNNNNVPDNIQASPPSEQPQSSAATNEGPEKKEANRAQEQSACAASEKQPEQKTTGAGEATEGKKKKKKKKKGKEKMENKEVQLEVVEKLPEDIPPESKDELLEENAKLKEQRQCKICMEKECNIVFLPCGHLVACQDCAPALRNCPICRALVRGTVKAFMS